MVNHYYAEKFCKEYWKIENYQEAVNDRTQTWHCHHRHEIDWVLPKEELIAIGRYYDVHHSELIFLTPREHKRLHMEGENNPNYGKECPWKGKVGPQKGKLSGKNNPMYGKHHTKETKQKISNAMKGRVGENASNYKYHITEEELYNLYMVQGLSQQKIAELYGCTTQTICNKLKKYNIKK